MKKKEIKSDGSAVCNCEMCCKQIPKSAAISPEGAEYVKYYCQDCYLQHHSKKKKTEE